jgi:hypothetical protein
MQEKVDEKGIIRVSRPSGVPFASVVISLFSFLLISLGTLSVVLLQKPLREVQNLAPQAAVQNGQVTISNVPSTTPLYVNQNSNVDFLINTNGVQTNGANVFFNVITDTTDLINIQVLRTSGLIANIQEVEKVADGFLVHVEAVPLQGASFSTNGPTAFLRISFSPFKTGSVQVSFDEDKSKSLVYGSTPARDDLKIVPVSVLTVADGAIQPSPTPSVTHQCNESCSNNSECQANFRCYGNQCRLATNVTSTVCAAPPDLGLQRKCNEYCADTRECSGGYTCFYNRCRRPDNPDSASCTTTTQTTAAVAKSCNVACSSNKDCSVNMRCFEGACRLATNPGSLSCSAYTQKTVSPLYGSKGEEIPAPASTTSATVSPYPSFRPSYSPSPFPSQVPQSMDNVESTGIFANILAQLQGMGLSFPMLAVGGGILLLILALLIFFMNRPRAQQMTKVTRTPQAAAPAQKNLEQRIAELRAEQTRPSGSTAVPAGQSTPSAAKPPSSAAQMTPPPSTLVRSGMPTSSPTQPPAQPSAQVPQSSTLMERIKSKGLMDDITGQKGPNSSNQ